MDGFIEKIDDKLYVLRQNFDGEICQETYLRKTGYLLEVES